MQGAAEEAALRSRFGPRAASEAQNPQVWLPPRGQGDGPGNDPQVLERSRRELAGRKGKPISARADGGRQAKDESRGSKGAGGGKGKDDKSGG